MTDTEMANRILGWINAARGDDLERCERSFAGKGPIVMASQYGDSGKTYQEVLDDYRKARAEWEECRLHFLRMPAWDSNEDAD